MLKLSGRSFAARDSQSTVKTSDRLRFIHNEAGKSRNMASSALATDNERRMRLGMSVQRDQLDMLRVPDFKVEPALPGTETGTHALNSTAVLNATPLVSVRKYDTSKAVSHIRDIIGVGKASFQDSLHSQRSERDFNDGIEAFGLHDHFIGGLGKNAASQVESDHEIWPQLRKTSIAVVGASGTGSISKQRRRRDMRYGSMDASIGEYRLPPLTKKESSPKIAPMAPWNR